MTAEFEQLSARQVRSRQISWKTIRILAQVMDSSLVCSVGFISYYIFRHYNNNNSEFISYFISISLVAAVQFLLFHSFGAYEKRCLLFKKNAIQCTLTAWATTLAVLLLVVFLLDIAEYFGRAWVITWFVSAGGLLIVARASMAEWIRRRAAEGLFVERAIIFGADELGQRLAGRLKGVNDPFIKVEGYIDDRTTRVPRSSKGLQILGNSATLLNLIHANMIDHVFIALPTNACDRVKQLIDQLARATVQVSVVFNSLELDLPIQTIKCVNQSLIVQVNRESSFGKLTLFKWIEDRLIAILALALVAPLMAVISVLIKFDSVGPIFVRQKRFGFNNNLIHVWAFRTRYVDQSERGGTLYRSNGDESRVTPLGRLLQKAGLDALPQLFNVLLGDMSIVGPHSLSAANTRNAALPSATTNERCAARHQVKPGITGWAQVNGCRGEDASIEQLRNTDLQDLHYLENWSIVLDFWIMIKAIALLFKRWNSI